MIINLIGCDGCGKSTQLNYLLPWLAAATQRPPRTISKRDIYNVERYPEARYLGPDYKELMYDILPDMKAQSRALFLFNMFAISICARPPAPDEMVVLDGGWDKHVATETAMGLDPAWLNNLTAFFPKPDLTLFLDVEPRLIVDRRKANGESHAPYECGGHGECSDARFLAHMNKVYAILLDMADANGWVRVDARQSPSHVFAASRAKILDRLSLSG